MESTSEREIRKRNYIRRVKKECLTREHNIIKKIALYFDFGKNSRTYAKWFEWTQCDNPEYNKYYKLLQKDIKENFDSYREVYGFLSDEESKECLLGICLWRVTRESEYLVDCYSKSIYDQYFEPFLKLTDHETFIDCGGYIGDSTQALIDYAGGLKEGYLYEADESNMTKAKDNLKNQNIIFRTAGVGEEKKRLVFSGLGLSSSSFCLSDDVTNQEELQYVDVVAIDEDIPKEIKTSFIKMDIEGMELEALKGAINHIVQDRPVLAICLYHNVEDIWQIPLYLHNILGDTYRYYIRHYTLYHGETVFYAVPGERKD